MKSQLFDENHKACETVFLYAKVVSTNELPFPKHNEKDKGQDDSLPCKEGH